MINKKYFGIRIVSSLFLSFVRGLHVGSVLSPDKEDLIETVERRTGRKRGLIVGEKIGVDVTEEYTRGR